MVSIRQESGTSKPLGSGAGTCDCRDHTNDVSFLPNSNFFAIPKDVSCSIVALLEKPGALVCANRYLYRDLFWALKNDPQYVGD